MGSSQAAGFFNRCQLFSIRAVSMEGRAIIALGFGYGAYEAEVFRAGIQSIGKGQTEAARSLGMTYLQAMRFIVLPQAIRRVLPPLGNDFIACLKDSSLATVLAVNELTQLGRMLRASNFRVLEVFNVMAFLYLSMTLLLVGRCPLAGKQDEDRGVNNQKPPKGGFLVRMRWGGLEPPRLAAHGPQPCLSASSSTSAEQVVL